MSNKTQEPKKTVPMNNTEINMTWVCFSMLFRPEQPNRIPEVLEDEILKDPYIIKRHTYRRFTSQRNIDRIICPYCSQTIFIGDKVVSYKRPNSQTQILHNRCAVKREETDCKFVKPKNDTYLVVVRNQLHSVKPSTVSMER